MANPTKSPLLWIAAAVAAAILVYSFSDNSADEKYLKDVKEWREAKDRRLKYRADESPLPDSVRNAFTALNYFAPDPKLRFRITPVYFENDSLLEIKTSSGEVRGYFYLAKLPFEFEGKNYELTAFRAAKPKDKEEETQIFVPFMDKTNGFETYGGGRYIDAESKGEQIVLDFNYAYSPYCAYNPSYSCPLPPAFNVLGFKAEAGEKDFK